MHDSRVQFLADGINQEKEKECPEIRTRYPFEVSTPASAEIRNEEFKASSNTLRLTVSTWFIPLGDRESSRTPNSSMALNNAIHIT